MSLSGYTGISYPFRISNLGGVVMSTTSANDMTHIEESLTQLFNTEYLERTMEAEVYSSISDLIFEPNDESLQRLLKSLMVEDITRVESRISCTEDDIDFTVEDTEEGAYLYAIITYTVLKYQVQHTSKIKVGEVANG